MHFELSCIYHTAVLQYYTSSRELHLTYDLSWYNTNSDTSIMYSSWFSKIVLSASGYLTKKRFISLTYDTPFTRDTLLNIYVIGQKSFTQCGQRDYKPICIDSNVNVCIGRITTAAQSQCWCLADIFGLYNLPSWGLHEAHLGPVCPRWSPCWVHEHHY